METADSAHDPGNHVPAPPFAIRRLGPGDEAVLALLAGQADDFDLAGRTTPEDPLSAKDAADYLADPMVLHWVAEEDGRVVGEIMCHVLRMPSGEARELLLYAIGVRAGDRRRGVGAALVREMLGWMEDAGIPLVWVLADNPGAEAFYAASGFERGGEDEQGVLMLRDTTGDGDGTSRDSRAGDGMPRRESTADGDGTSEGTRTATLGRHGRKRRGGECGY
jgi:GNAT superfamily N-acetyltransferase